MKDTVSKVKPSLDAPKMEIKWEYLEHLIDRLANKIPKDKYKGIYGIPRGGLVPAVMLSHKMNIPMVETLDDDILVVDDICDSGLTLQEETDGTPRLDSATVFVRNSAPFKPTFHAQEIYGEEWVIFPYEKNPSK